jgi:anti-anti-sigma regulatory factor
MTHLANLLSPAGAIEMNRGGGDYCSRPDLTTVLVDLGELTFCDGIGLRELLTFRRIHEAQGRSVVVVRVTPFIQLLMRILGINHWFEVVPSHVLVRRLLDYANRGRRSCVIAPDEPRRG